MKSLSIKLIILTLITMLTSTPSFAMLKWMHPHLYRFQKLLETKFDRIQIIEDAEDAQTETPIYSPNAFHFVKDRETLRLAPPMFQAFRLKENGLTLDKYYEKKLIHILMDARIESIPFPPLQFLIKSLHIFKHHTPRPQSISEYIALLQKEREQFPHIYGDAKYSFPIPKKTWSHTIEDCKKLLPVPAIKLGMFKATPPIVKSETSVPVPAPEQVLPKKFTMPPVHESGLWVRDQNRTSPLKKESEVKTEGQKQVLLFFANIPSDISQFKKIKINGSDIESTGERGNEDVNEKIWDHLMRLLPANTSEGERKSIKLHLMDALSTQTQFSDPLITQVFNLIYYNSTSSQMLRFEADPMLPSELIISFDTEKDTLRIHSSRFIQTFSIIPTQKLLGRNQLEYTYEIKLRTGEHSDLKVHIHPTLK